MIEPWDERSADLYELLHRGEDHGEEAELVRRLAADRAPRARTLLDVACGTGWHLAVLKRWYEVEGLDGSGAMLERAAARLSGVPLHHADMRGFELGRRFDVVTCLSSAIAWMRTEDDLHRAVNAMAGHLAPGGLLVIEPWPAPGEEPDEGEPWVTSASEPGRTVVMMETTRLEGRRWIQDSHYLICTARGIEHVHETTELAPFARDDLRATIGDAGLSVEYITGGLHGRGLWLGLAPE